MLEDKEVAINKDATTKANTTQMTLEGTTKLPDNAQTMLGSKRKHDHHADLFIAQISALKLKTIPKLTLMRPS